MPTLTTINVGAAPNDGTGDSIRDAFTKVRDNFNTIETTLVPTLITQEVANINAVFTGGTISNATTITDGTNSTNSSTGALVVVGGIGVGGSANFASDITSPLVTATSVTANTITAALTGSSTGAHNGTVGATTPDTGAFTSVNATTITSSGDATVGGDFIVTGDATFNGQVNFSGTISYNNINASGTITAVNLESTGSSTFDSATVTNALSVGTDITATGGVTADTLSAANGITGNLTGEVTGNVTGNVTGDVTGNVTGNLDGIVGGTAPTSVTATSITSDSITSSGFGTFGDIISNGSITATSTITTSTGNMVVSAGNIYCLRSDPTATDGRIFGSFGSYAFVSTGRLRAGEDGGSSSSTPNEVELYAEDGPFIIKTQAKPASSTDTGTAGEIRIADDGGTLYFYYCTAANTWVRTAFSTF